MAVKTKTRRTKKDDAVTLDVNEVPEVGAPETAVAVVEAGADDGAVALGELEQAVIETLPEEGGNGEAIELGAGHTLLQDVAHATYQNLETAIDALVKVVRRDEYAKIEMARIVSAIARQRLYEQANYPTFKAFIPELLKLTRSVGWKSDTSIKRYLAFVRTYLEQLQLNVDNAVLATSHLHGLLVLAAVDRGSGELVTSDKPGKLTPADFEDITHLVTYLVAAPTERIRPLVADGADDETLGEVLEQDGLGQAAATYERIMGAKVTLPVGGWKTDDTDRIIEKVRSDELEAEEDAPVKVERVWIGYETHGGKGAHIERLEFRVNGEAIDTVDVAKDYSYDALKIIAKGDTLQVAGKDGEQAEDEGNEEE
jgi:hypothetical protein